jgi:hypothetical protein
VLRRTTGGGFAPPYEKIGVETNEKAGHVVTGRGDHGPGHVRLLLRPRWRSLCRELPPPDAELPYFSLILVRGKGEE